MVFSSIIFLFAFLPLVLVVYHAIFLPVTRAHRPIVWRRASNLFLLLASLVFYFWGESWLVWIIIASTLVDYFCGLVISGGFGKGGPAQLEESGGRTPLQRFGLILSIVSNLAFLGFFKYFNFGVDTVNAILPEAWRFDDVIRVTLPLGISFYTFQSMSYTIDVYRGRVKATRNLIDFAAFVTLFPQLVAGPIVRYSDVARQLVDRTITVGLFASGVQRFVVGLSKKVLIANTVAKASDKIFALPEDQLTMGLAWLGIVCYTLQIYYDFSGYSDMAIGLGRMLGFEFPENFNYPYISRSIGEFWRRWHISLSTWFRDYLYLPLGGNRCSPLRTYINLWVVFLLCGFWHGASWTYVIFGAYHGVFLVLERMGLSRALGRVPAIFGHAYALIVIMAGFVLFNSSSLHQTLYYLKAFVVPQADASSLHVHEYLSADVRIALALGVLFCTPIFPRLAGLAMRVADGGRFRSIVVETVRVVGLMAALLLCSMSLAAGTHNPFIYFRF